ncbi:hypothetical protein [Hymenobacter edaphi]|uniref:Uncharacterized protein n=1 Tax=Hymenobacter edaphi TaxID=2211146 RepID=A0A328B541_9BACT|nr:hypothetical protein [Hymenobacter edaphi]RAK61997.1 hypothetical protein DLM85_24655 [Hymenobacter edaphi]
MQPTDLFSTISEMRDGIHTLIQRGKPVSTDDLQQLLQAVEAKSRPTFDPASVARILAPSLLSEMPTPDTLRQAGQQAAAAVSQAVQQATAQSKTELAAAAAELQRSAQRIPRQVPVRGDVVGFTSLQAVAVFGGIVLVLVAGLAWAIASRNSTRTELATLQARHAQIERWFTFFVEHRQTLAKERPELARKYFPYPNDPEAASVRKK